MVSGILVALLLPSTTCASFFRAMKQVPRATQFIGDISKSYLTHSNLGGEGPDAGSEVMHISGISFFNNESTDLIVTADKSYKANDALENGVSHDFGLINVLSNSTSKFWFEFVDADTRERRNYSKIYLTVYDFDQSYDGTFEEAVASSATAYWLTNKTELLTNVSSENISWRSSEHGTSDDNPKDKQNMTPQQLNRSLTLLFENTGKLDITLGVRVSEGDKVPAYGRTFLFDFRPLLENGTEVRPSGWPVQAPGESGALFHMERAELSRNNLGGSGPDTDGLRGIVFRKAGFFSGYNLNIMASVATGTYEPYKVENNGWWNGWGAISGRCGSELDLRLSFVDSYDGFPLTVPDALLSLMGIGMDDDGGCAASVSLSDFENYSVVDTGLTVSQTKATKTFSKTSARTKDSSQVDVLFKSVKETRATIKWSAGNSGGSEILFKFGNA